MTHSTKTQNNTAPKEIDTAALDQVVGAGGLMIEARNQEQNDKLRSEESVKLTDK